MSKIVILVVLILGLASLAFYRNMPITQISNLIEPAKVEIADVIEEPKIEIAQPGTSALLPGAKWVPQSFNNCGPASTSMILQYFGHNVDQKTIQATMRTNPDDKNVFTYEVGDYLRNNFNIESKLLYNGDLERLKILLANGFYVLIEDYLHPYEDIGHFTILRGFDDSRQVFIADDSFLGINTVYPYEQFDQGQWKPFNREYMPVYASEDTELLEAIIGEDLDQKRMFEKAVERNQADIDQNPSDMYAYFNLGTSLYGLQRYEEANEAFKKSRTLGWPSRILWYLIQPIQNANAVGDYQQALELANIALVANDSYAEAHLEKAVAYEGLGDLEQAQREREKALFYAPN